jgi:hypothetical protein
MAIMFPTHKYALWNLWNLILEITEDDNQYVTDFVVSV